MASTYPSLSGKTLLLLLLPIFLSLPTAVNAISSQELESMLAALRSRGYNLFPNAIATSDLHLDLLSLPSLTLFAPTDSALFALDMTQSASSYTLALRFHALPHRLSLADLRSLPSPSSFPTLLPSRALNISLRPPDSISVDGISVVFPGLYYGSHLAVHGLGGILFFRSYLSGSPPVRPNNSRHGAVNRTALFPVPKIHPRNRTRHEVFAPEPMIVPPVNVTVSPPVPENPVNRTVLSPAPEPASDDGAVSPPVQGNETSTFPSVNGTVGAPINIDGYSPADSPGYELWTEISPGPQFQQPEDRTLATPSPSTIDGAFDEMFKFPELILHSLTESAAKDGCSGEFTDEREAGKQVMKSGPSDGENGKFQCQVAN